MKLLLVTIMLAFFMVLIFHVVMQPIDNHPTRRFYLNDTVTGNDDDDNHYYTVLKEFNPSDHGIKMPMSGGNNE